MSAAGCAAGQARHRLKTWPREFRAVLGGHKTHEVRLDDRGFKAGDELMLEEWDPATGEYTGSHVLVAVTYATHGGEWGVPPGYVVMSIRVESWATGGREET